MAYGGSYAPLVTTIVGLHFRGFNPPEIARELAKRRERQKEAWGHNAPSAWSVRYILKAEGHLGDAGAGDHRRVSLAERQLRYRELGRSVVELRKQGKTRREMMATLGVTKDVLRRARHAFQDWEEAADNPLALLTPTTRKRLAAIGVDNVAKLAAMSEARLKRLPNFGPVKLAEVVSLLAAHGRTLRAAPPRTLHEAVALFERIYPEFPRRLVIPQEPQLADIEAAARAIGAELGITDREWASGRERHGALNAAALVVAAASASSRRDRRARRADGRGLLRMAADQVDPWRTIYSRTRLEVRAGA
jgi:hypothetical protein